MSRMTDDEAQALADEFAKNPPKVTGDGKSRFFMKHKGNIIPNIPFPTKSWVQGGLLFKKRGV